MKTDAIRSLRRKLAADTPVLGLWVTLESPSIIEMAVALGMDWVVIDAEHGIWIGKKSWSTSGPPCAATP